MARRAMPWSTARRCPDVVEWFRSLTCAAADLLTVSAHLPTARGLVVGDSALRQRAGHDGPASMAPAPRPGLGRGAARGWVWPTRGPDPCSRPLPALALRQAGLPVECQVLIQTASVGSTSVVDGWLVVELDGFAYHCDRDRLPDRPSATNGLRGSPGTGVAAVQLRGRDGPICRTCSWRWSWLATPLAATRWDTSGAARCGRAVVGRHVRRLVGTRCGRPTVRARRGSGRTGPARGSARPPAVR